MRLRPLRALIPKAELSSIIAAVPYDTISTADARRIVQQNKWSFLRITRSEVEFAENIDPYSKEVYLKAASNLRWFEEQGALVRESAPYFYAYRMQTSSHTQCGIVGCCNTTDYKQNLIKKHENTRPDKENDRVNHIEILRAHAEPVLMMCKDNYKLETMLSEIQKQPSLFDFVMNEVRHTLWRITEVNKVIKLFEDIPQLYIADGHHRSSAAVKAAENLRKTFSFYTDAEYEWFPAVIFPETQLKIMPYNRCVLDLNGLSHDDFLKAISARCELKETTSTAPDKPHIVHMYLKGRWYAIRWNDNIIQKRSSDPIATFDVTLLQNDILSPILGISDPRTDKRILFIGGKDSVKELCNLVDSGKASVGFSMFPVSVAHVMTIADMGGIMPPKSTWFEPKPLSGLFVHTF